MSYPDMPIERKIMQCHLCTQRCPQAEMADEIARGRMFATKELIECQKELEAYRAIGTPEECRAAVEKQKAKSRIIIEGKYFCPVCKNLMPYAGYCGCGQRLY